MKKIDENYIQYLNVNKGFNKEIFGLNLDSYKFKDISYDLYSDIDDINNHKRLNLDNNTLFI